jgi:TetR/AcrR family transcriptional regulator, transcriptional repressor for nem operon
MLSEYNRSGDILTAAELLFRTKGYKATSMNDVADMCRMQKPSLYHHFAAKEQLALAVMAAVQERFDTSIFSYAHDQTLPCDARLLKMNKAVEQFFSVENGGCLFSNLAIEQMDSIPAFAEPIRHYFDSWVNAFCAIFSPVYGATAAKSLATDFTSDLQGALIMMRVTKGNKPLLRLSARLHQTLRVGLPRKEGRLEKSYVEASGAHRDVKIRARVNAR